MGADLVAVGVALALAIALRVQGNAFPATIQQLHAYHFSLLGAIPLYLGLFAGFRLYRHVWRFAGLETLWSVIVANTLGITGFVLLQLLLHETPLSHTRLILFWLLSILLTGGIRIFLRMFLLGREYLQKFFSLSGEKTDVRRVVILGGGWDGARLLRALHEEFTQPYTVVGFLDDEPQKQGLYIRGVQVLGPLTHLFTLLEENAVDEVLIAIPKANGAAIRAYVLACRNRKIPVRVIPRLADVLRGAAPIRLADISVEDLLRRDPVCTDLTIVGEYVTGKRVLVTGAGGSIGSELCRQIMAQQPAELVLLGRGENSIHQISQELIAAYPDVQERVHIAIASVADAARMRYLFQQFKPQVVFHAAAHKHVPIMEENIAEAVLNNVFGTRYVAEACGDIRAERMVLISTDKAVFPSSVMGATKWLCEETIRTLATVYPQTAFIAVRFGNVLGSRGSVVPIFAEQIRRGGPVTVTHPEMTRYFMTIPEAVQLVLQAGAIGQSGELFILDMGEPVKIADLACDMIRLCGLQPEKDIRIAFTGLRPGEKLHEQLVMDPAHQRPARCERMSVVTCAPTFTPEALSDLLARFSRLVQVDDKDALLQALAKVVPGFEKYVEAKCPASQRAISGQYLPSPTVVQ